MTNLPPKGNSDSLDNVAVTREQFRQDIGEFLEFNAQALGAVNGTYTTQSVDPLAVVLQGTPTLAANAEPAGSDSSLRIANTRWVKQNSAGPASETSAGIAEIATLSEVAAGTDDLRFVTPFKLASTYVTLSGDTMSGDLTVPSINEGPLAGFRNQVINGNFTVNQRNGTRTPGNGIYGYDRWMGHPSGLEQIIEALPAGEYTLSWTGGGVGTFGGSSSVSPITRTVNTGNTQVVVPSTANSVQLEPGPVATPFEIRPIAAELALCQRYYWRGLPGTDLNFAAYSNTAVASWPVMFPQTMRTAPTLTANLSAATYQFASPASWGQSSPEGGRFLLSSTSTNVNCYIVFNNSYLEASAEL